MLFRSILRQDPDVIMIGEIRDHETAQIAIQASLTGHLVLATLHTNDAPSAVTRLTDMGIEPFLLSSSLLGVLAQRLVRKLCPVCKRLGDDGRYHPVGCEACSKTGYKGRTGVYELMAADDKLRELIHQKAPEQELIRIFGTHGLDWLVQIKQTALASALPAAGDTIEQPLESEESPQFRLDQKIDLKWEPPAAPATRTAPFDPAAPHSALEGTAL